MKAQSYFQEISARANQGIKSLAVLIDPDSIDVKSLAGLIQISEDTNVDYFFIGGSTVSHEQMDLCVKTLKNLTKIPLIIFPGSTTQLHTEADALLFLSLLSGRNADYLIGKQVESVPFLRDNRLEVIPTGYILIESGNETTVAYISQTKPIPTAHTEIILNTALAGQYLGMKMIYLEAGSGAKHHVPVAIVAKVKAELSIPLIVGGGIRTAAMARALVDAGADLIVVGNVLEKDAQLLTDLSIAVHAQNQNFIIH